MLKLHHKEQFKKQQEQPVIELETRLLIKLQEPQKLYQKIFEEQMKKKYLEKNIYVKN